MTQPRGDQWTVTADGAPGAPVPIRTLARDYLRRRATWQRTAPAVVAVAARLAVRRFRPADAAAVALGVALYGPLEWVTHHNVLHSLPLGPLPVRPDSEEARSHMAHHEDPDDIELLFVPLDKVPRSLIVMTAGAVVAAPVFPLPLTLLATELVLMSTYHWVHYLMHARYEGRTRWYLAVEDNHLRHHYDHDERWRMGVQFATVDRVVGALRARGAVVDAAPEPVGPLG